MATKVVPRETKNGRNVVKVKTLPDDSRKAGQGWKWWKANSKREMCGQVLETANFLRDLQLYRYRQAAIYARLYGNMPISNFIGSTNRFSGVGALPIDRPTMNVVQSCIDTLVSRLTQSRPKPTFLTDNGDYRQRKLAKEMNTFINGELYQTGAYAKAALTLRDASVEGTGCIKIFRTNDNRVGLDRVLFTELLVDPNDAYYGDPRQLFHLKLVDKSILAELFPDHKSEISKAEQAYPDNSSESQQTISEQVMVVEAWHLPSGKDADDGRHVIACSSGLLLDEEWKRDKFPFVFLHYSPRFTGFWGQGLAEQLMGTQVEINKLLMTISQSINLVGVPRVFVEDGSKVVKAHLNNQVGSIVTYRGTKPIYEVAPCVPQELYAQLERLVQYAYNQSGISTLAASAQKPAGLNSGEAIRNYDDIQSDRFATLSKRYDELFVDLAYQIIDFAKDIADEEGSYQTVYPNRQGAKEIDLPKFDLDDPFVIQCFDASSLPRDPAGRLEKVTEMAQAGFISPQEARRLLDYPDIEQVDKLDNAGEERILQVLDQIVEEGKYSPPDPFMDLDLANKLCVQYYNLYESAKLEDKKLQGLRDFFTQIQALREAAVPPAPALPAPLQGMGAPTAAPEPTPTNPLIPNAA